MLSNHDVTRHPTRLGGGELGLRRARAATLMMLSLPGGAYVYQGEELGLEEVWDIPADLRQDPIFFRTGGERVGRDGCRVPLPWSGTTAPFGFGPAGEPWLPQPAQWGDRTVEAELADPSSSLNFYRSALALRRTRPELHEDGLTWLPAADGMLAFRRGDGLVCAVNMTGEPLPLPVEIANHLVLIASMPGAVDGLGRLAADCAVWLSGS